MIDSLAMHGIQAKDLVPALMTTHTVANPEYDPAEARRQAEEQAAANVAELDELELDSADLSETVHSPPPPYTSNDSVTTLTPPKPVQTTAKVLEDTSTSVPGVSTRLSAADENVTLDIRWTVLCDLFLVLIADSVYDARSRVLIENVALKLGLGWLDVVRFERRVTEALEIEESVEKLEQGEAIKQVQKNTRKRRFMMLGLERAHRRWTCHRALCRSSCTCDWCWAGCCIHHHRYHRYYRFPGGYRWSCRHHDGWCVDGLRSGGARNGKSDAIRSDV